MANHGRDPKREAFWRGVLKRQRAVELTVRAFCRQEQLSEASFYAWRRTILERDAEAERSQPASSVPAVQPTFLPVLLNDNGHPEGGLAIELAGGRRLRYIGLQRNRSWFLMTGAVYNLIRIAALDAQAT